MQVLITKRPGVYNEYMRRTYILAILDGWGIGETDNSNPIYQAKPENMSYIESRFPCGTLQASGIAVGLPWGEEGNSEIGHLTLGAGKIFYQHFPKISLSIRNGMFFKNEVFKQAFAHTEKNNGAAHLVGLVGEGSVHSSIEHLFALIQMAKQEGCKKLFIHAISDGRDSPLNSISKVIKKIEEEIKKCGVGKIATLSGRYYAMDRDKHWDRTEKAYNVLINSDSGAAYSINEVIKKARDKNLSDEFIEPTVIDTPHPIKDGDAIIFFNFREDRMRQITEPFLVKNFAKFPTKNFNNLYTATMTQYHDTVLSEKIAFPKEIIENTLGKTLSENSKTQLRIAETEKYAHVTYFFNGLQETPYKNEYRILIQSRNITRQEEHPEMMAEAITDRAIAAMNEGGFDFILINYANPDIIAHTGNFDATVKAIQAVDKEIGRLAKNTINQNHLLFITSDHGNAEVLLDNITGEPETKHDASPVPFYVVGKEFEKQASSKPLFRSYPIGIISDVAPTILSIMKLPVPKEMTGQNLLEQLL